MVIGMALPLGWPGASVAQPRDDGLMLLLIRELGFEQGSEDVKDEAVLECVRNRMLQVRPSQRDVSFDEFRAVAFPALQRAAAPRRPEYLKMLFDTEAFRQRVAPLGLRYIAFIGGVTETEQGPSGVYGVGNPYGVLIAHSSWHKATRLSAMVLDLKTGGKSAPLTSAATGTSWFVLIGVIPLGGASDTVGEACQNLGARLGAFLDEANK